jgi:hypothetical protein
MLRLRAYEKLQNMVQLGGVQKNGKDYRGIPSGLAVLRDHLAANHCRELLAAARHATRQ